MAILAAILNSGRGCMLFGVLLLCLALFTCLGPCVVEIYCEITAN